MSNTVVAVTLAIFLCPGGETPNGLSCPDGDIPKSYSLSLMVSKPDGDFYVWLERAGKPRFWMKTDGTTWAEPGFKVDGTAFQFWKSMGESAPFACEAVRREGKFR